MKESTETLGTASVLSRSEKPHLQTLAEVKLERVSPPATSAETTLVMPAKLIDEPSSLKTEEIYQRKIPVLLLYITSFSPSTPDLYAMEIPPITILQAAQIIYQLSKYLDSAPRHVHARILQSL